jgi:hypothetical protein
MHPSQTTRFRNLYPHEGSKQKKAGEELVEPENANTGYPVKMAISTALT